VTRIRCRRTSPRDDAGETLIELLVALMVIGTAVTAILGALVVAVNSSVLARNQTRVQAALRSWAEQVAAVGDTGTYRYVPCAAPSAFPAPDVVPSGFTATVTSVEYWTGDAWTDTCGTDAGVQRVTLRVTAPGRVYSTVTQSLDVVVRRPCASAAAC
jgi:type II secretory pathway pseudopilin PulG